MVLSAWNRVVRKLLPLTSGKVEAKANLVLSAWNRVVRKPLPPISGKVAVKQKTPPLPLNWVDRIRLLVLTPKDTGLRDSILSPFPHRMTDL